MIPILMRRILFYICFLFVSILSIHAQESKDQDSIPQEEKIVVPDTIPIQRYISIGMDLTGPFKQLAFDRFRSDNEFSISFHCFKKFNLTSEFGFLNINENVTINESNELKSQYNYLASGKFVNLGFDYNIFKKNKPGERNMVFFGLRYGFSTLKHSASNIFIEDPYWGNSTNNNFPETTVTAQWIEVAGGLRVYLFKNVALGWSGRYRILTHSTNIGIVNPIIIPGFGNGGNTTVWGFNYSIYITIP